MMGCYPVHQEDAVPRERLVTPTATVCGFVPMRGVSEHADQRIGLAHDAVLRVDAADLPDTAAIAQALIHRRSTGPHPGTT